MSERARRPLAIHRDSWRSRWLHTEQGHKLHRISEAEWLRDWPMIRCAGVSVCGISGAFDMPGILSRMALRRCAKCCDALGIPRGDGAPFNDMTLTKEQRDG